MKVLAILLVCAVAVQGRSTALEPVRVVGNKALASAGDAPYLVHLRIAVSTSGYLQTAAGSLISERWVLTSEAATQDARFIWVRYGAATVINPQLVTETSAVEVNKGLALVSINRNVEPTSTIAPVGLLVASEIPESSEFLSYGAEEDGSPGEQLSVQTIALEESEEIIVASGEISKHDNGAPLVVDGKQIAVLISFNEDGAAVFDKLDEAEIEWITETADL